MKLTAQFVRIAVLLAVFLLGVVPAAAAADFDLLDSQNVSDVQNVSTAFGGSFGTGKVYVAATSQVADDALRVNAIYTDSSGTIVTNFAKSYGFVWDTDVTHFKGNIVVVAANTESHHLKLIAFKTNGPSTDRLQRLGDSAGIMEDEEITVGDVKIIRVGQNNLARLVSVVRLPDGRVRFDVWRLSDDGMDFTLLSTRFSVGTPGKIAIAANINVSFNRFVVSAQDANDRMVVTLWELSADQMVKKAESLRGFISSSDISFSSDRIYTVAVNQASPLAAAEIARWQVINVPSNGLPLTLQYVSEKAVPVAISGTAMVMDDGNGAIVVAQTATDGNNNDWQTLRFIGYTDTGAANGLQVNNPIKTLSNHADAFDVAKNEGHFFMIIDGFVGGTDSHQLWHYNQ